MANLISYNIKTKIQTTAGYVPFRPKYSQLQYVLAERKLKSFFLLFFEIEAGRFMFSIPKHIASRITQIDALMFDEIVGTGGERQCTDLPHVDVPNLLMYYKLKYARRYGKEVDPTTFSKKWYSLVLRTAKLKDKIRYGLLPSTAMEKLDGNKGRSEVQNKGS